MPSRGYRKGVSDAKRPRPYVIKARITAPTYRALDADCDARSITLSALVDRVLEGYASDTRVELPHPNLNAPALRELCRIGNNLNQIARQANLMHLPLIEAQARAALAAVMDTVRRL